jgi:hypothetical protein
MLFLIRRITNKNQQHQLVVANYSVIASYLCHPLNRFSTHTHKNGTQYGTKLQSMPKRNDIIFGRGESLISASVEFLQNYIALKKPNNNLTALGKGKEISNPEPVEHCTAPQYDKKAKFLGRRLP